MATKIMVTNQNYRYALVDKLHFDPENPRLPSRIDSTNDQKVIEWMVRDATLIELMGAIGKVGFFPGEPLLVIPKRDNAQGEYTVVEGNRRLAAVKLLSNPHLTSVRKSVVAEVANNAEYKPEELPVIVYSERSEIIQYLGYRHITGIKEWSALAKARYLRDLLNTTLASFPAEEQYSALARTIGSRSDYVARLLTSLAVYDFVSETFESVDDNTISFSVFTTALSYKNIAQFVGMIDGRDKELKSLNHSNLRELTSWLFEKNQENQTRLGESRNLKILNRVVASPKALSAFRNGRSLREADLFTESPAIIFKNSILSCRRSLQAARDNSHLIEQGFSKDDSDLLLEITKLARQLKGFIDDQLLESEEI